MCGASPPFGGSRRTELRTMFTVNGSEVRRLLASYHRYLGEDGNVALFCKFLLARCRRKFSAVLTIGIPDCRQEVFVTVLVEIQPGCPGRMSTLDTVGEQREIRLSVGRAQEEYRTFSLYHEL